MTLLITHAGWFFPVLASLSGLDQGVNQITAPGLAQSWTWDAMGRVHELTTNGTTTTYGYDAVNGSLASAITGADTRTWNFDNKGEPEQEALNAAVLEMKADPAGSGALTRKENKRELQVVGSFHTNAVVKVLIGTNEVHTANPPDLDFTFNQSNVPALVNTNATVVLFWNVVGTRPGAYEGGQAVAKVAGTYVFAPQQETLVYDDAMRLEQNALFDLGWDAADQLKTLQERVGPYSIENEYDGAGRRVEKRVFFDGAPLRTHRFVYQGWLPIVEEVLDAQGNPSYTNSYIWGAGPDGVRNPGIGATGQLALILHQPKYGGPQLSAPVYNHRLDVVGLVDVETGDEVAGYRYSEFGESLSVRGARAHHCPFRFAGAYLDETETYYFGYRHYDPRTKQWLSRDPIGEAGGLNLFAYANNDPINGIDVLGLFDGADQELVTLIGLIDSVKPYFVGYLNSRKPRESQYDWQPAFVGAQLRYPHWRVNMFEKWDSITNETSLKQELGKRLFDLKTDTIHQELYELYHGNDFKYNLSFIAWEFVGPATVNYVEARSKETFSFQFDESGSFQIGGTRELTSDEVVSKSFDAASGYGSAYLHLSAITGLSRAGVSQLSSTFGPTVQNAYLRFGGSASKSTPASFFGNTRLEVQALQRQGLSRSEAFRQIRSFNAGNADGYLFHFTTQKGARGILGEGVINPSSTGVWGPGVYSGTTPRPGPFLKNTPYAGWGLGGKGANIRIPFRTTQPSVTPWLPPRTRVFRDPVSL